MGSVHTFPRKLIPRIICSARYYVLLISICFQMMIMLLQPLDLLGTAKQLDYLMIYRQTRLKKHLDWQQPATYLIRLR